MRAPRTFALLAVLCWCAGARATDPLRVELRDRATVGTTLVTVGDVATVTGGAAGTRAAAQALDLAELKVRQPSAAVLRRAVEYRLRLAGIDARVSGPERAAVTLATRPLTADEVLSAARTELFRGLSNPADAVIDLAAPIVTKLPEIPLNERPSIVAKPRGAPGPTGRVQVDVSVASGAEHLLSLAVQCDVQSLTGVRPAGGLVPASGVTPAGAAVPAQGSGFAAAELMMKSGDPIEIRVSGTGFTATVKGTALQQGKMGQTVQVLNTSSRKTVVGRVVGPRAVEVELGGAP
jgi:flagella basal body P-ring formation protein FlgA